MLRCKVWRTNLFTIVDLLTTPNFIALWQRLIDFSKLNLKGRGDWKRAQIFCAAGNFFSLKKTDQKRPFWALFGKFWPKNRVFSARAPPSKLIYIGAKGPFRKTWKSVIQKGYLNIVHCRFAHHAKFHCNMTMLYKLFKIEFERGELEKSRFYKVNYQYQICLSWPG